MIGFGPCTGLLVASLLFLSPAPSTSRKAGRRKRVGHDPFLQSTSPARWDASSRHEPYASLEARDASLPCTIERRQGLTRTEFEAEYMQKKPVVLVGGSGLLDRGSGKHPQDVRLSPGALGTAQVEIPKLLTETYAQSSVRTGRPEELPRGLVRHTEPLVEFLRRPYTEENVSSPVMRLFCC